MPPTLGSTPSQTVGPFFHDGLAYDAGPRLVAEGSGGAVAILGQVLDGDGRPVPDALVEVWQAAPDGTFVEVPGIFDEPTGFRGFGRCATDDDGRYSFATLKPAPVPTVDGTFQAPHLAMSVFARGMLRRLVTRVYFDDEAAANLSDPLLAQVGSARATTLLAHRVDGGYRFDVRIQGDRETVFLDAPSR